MMIKISNLKEGIHFFEFSENVEKIDLGEPFSGNVLVNVELNKLSNQIVIKAGIKVHANFECDRCTANYDEILENSYEMVYLSDSRHEHGDDLNVVYLTSDADKIILDEEVRDYVLLSVPMKKLCKEDCKGLCPVCGKDLNEGMCNCLRDNIDARWQPLMELKNKINNN
jgi:uncharacterized protein